MIRYLPLLFLALQDARAGDWEKLVRQLSHDEFSEREKADQKLREAGESARPALEKAILQDQDPERRSRCQEILAALDAALSLRRTLQTGWTVTIPEREYALGEFPGLLREQIPVVLEVPPALAESRVRIGIRNARFFQFLDRLTEAHGGIAFSAGSTPGSFRLNEGKPPQAPVCYPGSLRIALDRLTLESWERFGTTCRGASMVLAVTWQPDEAPIPLQYFPKMGHKITELQIFGDDGKQIRGIAAHHDDGSSLSREKMEPSSLRVRAAIPDPPPSMKRLSLIRGKLNLIFPTRIEMIEFKKPLAEAMGSKDVGVFTIKYSNCRRTDAGVIFELSFSRPTTPRGQQDERLTLAARYAEKFLRMVGVDAKEYPLHYMLGSQSSGSQKEIRQFSGYFDVLGDIASLKVPLVVNYFESPIDFEFRDVELP